MRSHQSNRLHQAEVQSRLTPGFVQEHPAVELLMLGTDHGQSVVGIEMNASHRTQPNRHIWKLWENSRLLGVSDEASGINEDQPLIQSGVKNIKKGWGGGSHPPLRRQHAHTNRAVKLTMKINAERPGVRSVII